MIPLLTINPNQAVAGAFDALATDYDASWTYSLTGHLQRQQVWHAVRKIFHAGDRILEVGCGTGADAAHLACDGVRVHATDISQRMLYETQARIRREGLSDRVTFEVIAVEQLSQLQEPGPFDGALSNFGAFNCVQDLRSTAHELARLLRPGGKLVICFMGRFCLWETFWYLLQNQPAKAFRRLAGKKGLGTSLKSGDRFSVFYPSVADLIAAFQKEFRLVSRRSIGVLVPPSYLEQWAKKHLRLVIRLSRLDERLGDLPVLRGAGDHRLAVFLRNEPE